MMATSQTTQPSSGMKRSKTVTQNLKEKERPSETGQLHSKSKTRECSSLSSSRLITKLGNDISMNEIPTTDELPQPFLCAANKGTLSSSASSALSTSSSLITQYSSTIVPSICTDNETEQETPAQTDVTPHRTPKRGAMPRALLEALRSDTEEDTEEEEEEEEEGEAGEREEQREEEEGNETEEEEQGKLNQSVDSGSELAEDDLTAPSSPPRDENSSLTISEFSFSLHSLERTEESYSDDPTASFLWHRLHQALRESRWFTKVNESLTSNPWAIVEAAQHPHNDKLRYAEVFFVLVRGVFWTSFEGTVKPVEDFVACVRHRMGGWEHWEHRLTRPLNVLFIAAKEVSRESAHAGKTALGARSTAKKPKQPQGDAHYLIQRWDKVWFETKQAMEKFMPESGFSPLHWDSPKRQGEEEEEEEEEEEGEEEAEEEEEEEEEDNETEFVNEMRLATIREMANRQLFSEDNDTQPRWLKGITDCPKRFSTSRGRFAGGGMHLRSKHAICVRGRAIHARHFSSNDEDDLGVFPMCDLKTPTNRRAPIMPDPAINPDQSFPLRSRLLSIPISPLKEEFSSPKFPAFPSEVASVPDLVSPELAAFSPPRSPPRLALSSKANSPRLVVGFGVPAPSAPLDAS